VDCGIGPAGGSAIGVGLQAGIAVLTNLNLFGNSIGPEGAAAIAEALKSGMAVLTECNVRGNNLNNESANALAKVATEKRVMLFGIKQDQTEADFSSQGLGPVDAVLVASDLRVSAVLTHLDLAGNELGADGAKAIAGALSSGMAVLTSLDISFNYIGPQLGVIMAEVLEKNAVLTDLNLRDNDLGPQGAAAIAEALKSGMAVLTTIDLQYNGFDASAKNALADAVKRRTAPLDLKL